jgi:DNA-binding transcriptional LysR family regulator
VLNDLQITMRNMRDVASEQRGQVIVSTYSAFAYQPFPQIVAAYRETRPQIEVRIREGRQPDILEDVRSGVADFGIGYVDTLPETLQSTTLRREPLYAMCPLTHSIATRRMTKIRFADIREESLVSLPPDSYTRRLVDGAAVAAGFSLRHRLIVTRFESVVRYVRSGAGVGIIPAGALPAKPWRDFHAAVLTAPSLSVTVGLIMLRGRYITPPSASLIALVRDHFKQTDTPARSA